ncbi:dynamin-related protein 3A-like protein, partial [Tanacetum coccineum]
DGTSVTCSDDCGRRFLRSPPDVAGGSGQSSWWRVKRRCVRMAGMGALILNILSKYSEAFSSMIEGKNEEMSTSELSGGARTDYIFRSIFVKSLEVLSVNVYLKKWISIDPYHKFVLLLDKYRKHAMQLSIAVFHLS